MKGIKNVRDLGGYRMQDGRSLRAGVLIRAAHLAEASDADLDHLSSIPVTKVVDFRKEEELQGKVDRPVPGAEFVRIPVDAVNGSLKCSDFGNFECSVFGSNTTVDSATMVQ
jgi:protein tyrosine/serine phosphatase